MSSECSTGANSSNHVVHAATLSFEPAGRRTCRGACCLGGFCGRALSQLFWCAWYFLKKLRILRVGETKIITSGTGFFLFAFSAALAAANFLLVRSSWVFCRLRIITSSRIYYKTCTYPKSSCKGKQDAKEFIWFSCWFAVELGDGLVGSFHGRVAFL